MEYKAGAGLSDFLHRAGGGGVWYIVDVVLMNQQQSISGPLRVLEFLHSWFCKFDLRNGRIMQLKDTTWGCDDKLGGRGITTALSAAAAASLVEEIFSVSNIVSRAGLSRAPQQTLSGNKDKHYFSVFIFLLLLVP